jgi:hypothetical protein
MDVRIHNRRARDFFVIHFFVHSLHAGFRTVGPRNVCDSEKTMAEAIECWQTLAIVPAEQSTAHQHQLQKHTGKSTATSIQCSSEGIVPKWFSFVSANVHGHPDRAGDFLTTKPPSSRSRVHQLIRQFCSGERATIALSPCVRLYRPYGIRANLE